MAECDWAILCDYSFLDSNQKPCLIGAFERVMTTAVPTQLHQSSLALKLLGNPEETINFRIEVLRPTGGVLAGVGGSAKFSAESYSVNVQLNFAGLALPDWGVYAVNVYVNEELSRTSTFTVIRQLMPPPKQPQQ